MVKLSFLFMFVTGMFSWYHEIFKNFFTEHLRATAVDFSISKNETFRQLQCQ